MRSSAPHRPPASHSGNQWGPVDNIQRSAEVNGLRPTSMAVVGIRRALRAPGAIGRNAALLVSSPYDHAAGSVIQNACPADYLLATRFRKYHTQKIQTLGL
ncbi:hypothetical protein VTO73DRAFT_12842 [Trametes versicolor]